MAQHVGERAPGLDEQFVLGAVDPQSYLVPVRHPTRLPPATPVARRHPTRLSVPLHCPGQCCTDLGGQHRDVVEARPGAGERVVDRVEHASGRPDHAALAHALGPALAEGGRGLQVDHLHRAHLRSRGYQVVHQRRADRLSLGVVADPLVQRGRHALGDPAQYLAVHDERVDDHPAVLHDQVSQYLDLAGARIDGDQRGMTGVGEGARRIVGGAGLQAVTDLLGQQVRLEVHHPGDLGQRYRRAGVPPDPGHALVQFHVGGAGFEQVRRCCAEPVRDLLRGPRRRTAADHDGPAGKRPPAVGGQVGIALPQPHLIRVHAQPVGDDLREGGLVPLAVRGGTGRDDDLAGGVHPHRGGVVAGGHPHPAQ